jgi:oligoribonuclease
MTGLDVLSDRLLEICAIVTDRQFNIIAQSPSYVIFQPPAVLEQMDEWNQQQHRQSGLYSLVAKSSYTATLVDELLTQWALTYVAPKTAPLCGNSVHQDRFFLKRYLPNFEQILHYRHIDVSTLKELYRDRLLAPYEKIESDHRAGSDIHASIQELKFYLKQAQLLHTDDTAA